MVVGKAGRAETPTDPAPMDMIETMVNFRPRAFWPRRKLRVEDARRQTSEVLDALVIRRGVVATARCREARTKIVDEATAAALVRFDAVSREFAYQRNQEVVRGGGRDLADVAPSLRSRRGPAGAAMAASRRAARRGAPGARGADLHQAGMDQLLERSTVIDADPSPRIGPRRRSSAMRRSPRAVASAPAGGRRGHHHASLRQPRRSMSSRSRSSRQSRPSWRGGSARRSSSGRSAATSWSGSAASSDRAVQMPGWTNVWTMPIQNRVDMLSTGVNTPIGIRVLGRNLDDVVKGADEVARVVKGVPGAVDVLADPIRGKPYIEVRLDRERAARLGVRDRRRQRADRDGPGRPGRHADRVEGRERHPVVVRYPRALREDEESIREPSGHGPRRVARARVRPPLGDTRCRSPRSPRSGSSKVPATIKGENGLLRSYVRLSAQRARCRRWSWRTRAPPSPATPGCPSASSPS